MSNKQLPRDARLVALLLAANGAEDCEEGVIRSLIEFAHRYTTDVLTDSLVYAEHGRGSATIASTQTLVPNLDDIRLAVQARADGATVPKEFLLSLASAINSLPLPAVPEVYGIRLPPPASRITAPNFSLIPRTAVQNKKREDSTLDSEDGQGLFGSEGNEEEEDDDDDDEEMEDVTAFIGGGLSAKGTHFDGKRKATEDLDEGRDDEYD